MTKTLYGENHAGPPEEAGGSINESEKHTTVYEDKDFDSRRGRSWTHTIESTEAEATTVEYDEDGNVTKVTPEQPNAAPPPVPGQLGDWDDLQCVEH